MLIALFVFASISKNVDSLKPLTHEKSIFTCICLYVVRQLINIQLLTLWTCSLGDKTFADIAAKNVFYHQ